MLHQSPTLSFMAEQEISHNMTLGVVLLSDSRVVERRRYSVDVEAALLQDERNSRLKAVTSSDHLLLSHSYPLLVTTKASHTSPSPPLDRSTMPRIPRHSSLTRCNFIGARA